MTVLNHSIVFLTAVIQMTADHSVHSILFLPLYQDNYIFFFHPIQNNELGHEI